MNPLYILLGVFVFVFLFIIVLTILRKMKGSIEVIPERYSYNLGETIKGKIILKLKKPVKSDKLIVGLRCDKSERVSSIRSRSGSGSRREKYTLFDFSQPLENEKEYTPAEYSYNFSIKIPENISQTPEGITGTFVESLQTLSGRNPSIKWYIHSTLQCQGVNLRKDVQVNIG
jgi:hypothetical protein